VRITNVSGSYDNNQPKDVKRMGESSAITAVYLSDAGRPVARPVSSAAIGADYLGSFANRKGEVAILSYSNGQGIIWSSKSRRPEISFSSSGPLMVPVLRKTDRTRVIILISRSRMCAFLSNIQT
jgi:hypothetical protein